MAQKTLHTISTMKANGEKISMLTSYDATFTHRINEAGVDMILVGDSLGMVLQGKDSTLPVTIEDMVYHTRCVKAGNSDCLIMSDMPFMTYRTPEEAMTNAAALMQAGAQIVKLEGGMWLQDTVAKLYEQASPFVRIWALPHKQLTNSVVTESKAAPQNKPKPCSMKP